MMQVGLAILHMLLALALAPLLFGIVNRVKARFGGRCGRPLLQAYFDFAKLLRKGAVYSRTTSWVFRAGPVIGLTASVAALLLMPLAGVAGLASFPGDLVLLAYVLALGRFFTMTAALDTGSAFEGMGASREAAFSAQAEPALFLGLAALALHTHAISLSAIYAHVAWSPATLAPLLLIAAALFVTLLVENSRIPFDDPETHLELTMIHEAMVLDHSGPDFFMIRYGAAVKLWVGSALITNLVAPAVFSSYPANLAVALAVQALVAVAVGVVESIMARLRIVRVPQMLTGSAILSLLAVFFFLRSLV